VMWSVFRCPIDSVIVLAFPRFPLFHAAASASSPAPHFPARARSSNARAHLRAILDTGATKSPFLVQRQPLEGAGRADAKLHEYVK
jgi:hypothetical protein